ncbi:serine/threonine protein kinase [Lentzea tibetensis]|uniref:non-specific serine/threonine protein kinase n=2 Tax=Lentzea tibetensis TaxID=2591470 RepID=A0A563EG50_9PSEU|nr:serine/threonine protein kinase [Lentzea tibetensis]
MGVVWLAEDQVIGRQVALKELRTSSKTDIERVLREARTAGKLNSPHVVGIHDVISEHGVTYLVMELVEAPTLSDLMAREGALPEARVADIALQVLSALEAAHAAGIVHRDVKPSNIMVLPDGRAKLADFGIARAMDDPGLTATGGIMGSPGYMAPELFAGDPPSPASDLWALGATMFHAVEGRSPFTRETTAATMHAIMYDRPALSRADGPLASVIMGLLTPVGQRLTAAQLRAHLQDGTRAVRPADTVIVEAPTSLVTPASTAPSWAQSWDDEEKPKSRRKIGIIAGAAAVVVVVALAAVFLIKPDQQTGTAAAQQGTDPASSSAAASSTPESSASSAPSSAPSSSAGPTSSNAAAGPKPTQSAPNNPVPTTTKPKPPRETLPLARYRNGGGWHYSGTSRVPVPAGFSVENTGGLGKLLANPEADTKPLYTCRVNNSEDRMSSGSSTCESQTVYGTLGYVFSKKPADVEVLPLFRCNMGGHHFDSVTTNCEGYQVEFQFGWVVR